MANDVTKVGVPVTGFATVAPFGTSIPSPTEGGSTSFTLPTDYQVLGLRTEDGAPEWTMEADGDPIVFFEEGYSIPSGLSNVSVVMKLAQSDRIVREVTRGRTYDENGYMTVDGGGTDKKYVLFVETIFKNGAIERRVAPNASIASVKEDKDERGTPRGTEVTFNISRSEVINNDHFAEWNTLARGVAPAVAGK